MANALYDTFKQGCLDATQAFNLDSDTIQVTLIDGADYTFSAAHDDYAGSTPDVAASAKVSASGALGSLSITNGVFDTADFTFSSVTGDQSEALILWDDSLTDDRLILYMDSGITGMPVTPNGGDINGTVHTAGWFSL